MDCRAMLPILDGMDSSQIARSSARRFLPILAASILTHGCANPDQSDPSVNRDRTQTSIAGAWECDSNSNVRLDSAAASEKAIDAVYEDHGLPIGFTISTFRSDSTGYTLRVTPVDPPGAMLFGAAGIVRVCLDGRTRVLTLDQPVQR